MLQEAAFVDYRKVHLKAGDGGTGAVSFLSVFGNEFAGPDGGDGGNGGHIVLRGKTRRRSLTCPAGPRWG